MEIPEVPDLQYLTLPDRPHCRIAYTYKILQQSKGQDVVWLVFVNGLGLPQAFWQPCLQLVQKGLSSNNADVDSAKVITTTYDRYAQGLSKLEDNRSPVKHDLADAANELEEVLSQIQTLHKEELSKAHIVLVAHSIGVPLARLYSDKQSSTSNSVVGAIFLDSNMANINMVSILPDPASPNFDASKLPADTTLQELKWTRANYERMFAPSAPNPENLDRSTLPGLLPYADRPKLHREARPDVQLTIIAHDPDAFATEGLKISTRGLTEQYIEPAWHKYNIGLLTLNGQDDRSADEIVIAAGAGHFIQRDNPQVVAAEILKMLDKIHRPR